MKKNRSACYRQNRILESSLNRYKQQVNMYRKRLTRLRKKITPTNGDTPRSKTRKLLRRQHDHLDVRRTLNYHHALVQSSKTKFRNCMKEKERSIDSHIVLSGITKRYRKIAEASLGFSRRSWKTAKRFAETGLPCRQRVASKMAEALKSEVKKFYIRDYVSRSTTGKKETRTMLKEKKQKRFLTDTMQTLHARFISEFHGTISYSLFCRLRPYWVVVPTAADRNTCQCKTHDNLAYRHVSCFCSPKEQFNSECFNTRHFSFITEERQVAKTASLQPVFFSPDLTCQHCIGEYDGHPYPGMVVAVDQ